MPPTLDPAAHDKLTGRIRALLSKTVQNGCTEDEALAAAAKAAELLDRHDLSLSDVDLREIACVRMIYETHRKKRIPIADCIGAVAHFCDCKVWREKNPDGDNRFVFFGLPADAEVALYLTGVIDAAVRTELGRYKTSRAYLKVRHQDRHLANASFTLGMVTSIANKLDAMKTDRDQANAKSGRDLVVVKTSIIEQDLSKLGLTFRTTRSAGRTIAPDAFEAGGNAGQTFTITPGLKTTPTS
ncbi:DUF2786 domain-containing protein [Lichenihabitans sp. PAMC28606]|uniref:DUF7168 domain-containing protein n=1 Tax=Lichenihabitans sp. PAMC28606 TaxID=2880932 RepID=UPI001D0AC57C|nr:DUF2786 domain-containing protein [Lichenihabitans sp. PAMC28606]UDL96025.1 DUF2786 domain-containing protein [Lichenihabitans sp. PAMC28606]